MSPAVLRPRASEKISRRSDAVVLSLNAWQIFGLCAVVVCLIGLAVGWFWWQKRSRLANAAEADSESHPPVRDKDTNGTIPTTEAQELDDMPKPRPQKTHHHDDGVECSSWVEHVEQSPGPAPVPVLPQKEEDTNGGHTNTPTNALKLEHMFREPTQDAVEASNPEDVKTSHGA